MACLFCWGRQREREQREQPRPEHRAPHRVVLESKDSSFGLVLGGHQDVQGLILVEVKSCHPVVQWNQRQPPSRRIAVGQAILEVNGATDVREMLQQFRNARRVEVLIQPQLTREQRLVFQSSMVKHQRSVMAREVLQLVPTPEANGSQPDAATVEACSICHEAMELKEDCEHLADTPCGHRFHMKCVKEWLISGRFACPLCNQQLGKDWCDE